MAKILEESQTLKKLSLSGDLALGEAGVIAIGMKMKEKGCDFSVMFSFDNNLSLGEALQTNSSLESINLSCKSFFSFVQVFLQFTDFF